MRSATRRTGPTASSLRPGTPRLAALLVLVLCGPASAVWLRIPLEDRVASADLVLVGSFTAPEVGEEIVEMGPDCRYRIDFGTLAVTEVLKGDPRTTSVRLAHYTHSSGAMIACPAPRHYEHGDRGVWLLHRDEGNSYFWASHIGDLREMEERPAVRRAIAFVANVARTGLRPVLRVAGHREGFPSEPRTLEFRIQNTGRDPLRIRRSDLAGLLLLRRRNSPKAVATSRLELGPREGHELVIEPGGERVLAMVTCELAVPGRHEIYAEVALARGDLQDRLKPWAPWMWTGSTGLTVFDPGRLDGLTGMARKLVAARRFDRDPSLRTYVDAIRTARANLTADLVRQLVRSSSLDILEDLYLPTPLIPGDPSFAASAEARREALRLLVEAMDEAAGRYALQNVLILFLRTGGIGSIELALPEVGQILRLKVLPRGGCVYDTGRLPGSDVTASDPDWSREIEAVSRRCQDWCRERMRGR